jgi:hypothetical protein
MPTSKRYFTSVYNNEITQGARSTFEVKNLGGNNLQGVFISCWMTSTTGRTYWLQTGYHQWGGVDYFTMLFTGDGEVAAAEVELLPAPTINAGETHTWSIQLKESGRVYVAMDGVEYAYWPLDIARIDNAAISFESVGTTNRPLTMPNVTFNKALELHQGGIWVDAADGYASGSGYGIKVNSDNNVTIGSSIKFRYKPYTQLW